MQVSTWTYTQFKINMLLKFPNEGSGEVSQWLRALRGPRLPSQHPYSAPLFSISVVLWALMPSSGVRIHMQEKHSCTSNQYIFKILSGEIINNKEASSPGNN